ncbi:hypothetical protein ES705_16707 [subsurface metagenome]
MTRAFKKDVCPFCHQHLIVSWHHVFGGTKTMRKFSEKYNAIIWPCWKCHVTNSNSIHRNAKLRRQLKARHQKRIMREQGWDLKRWIEEVGENYLNEKTRIHY